MMNKETKELIWRMVQNPSWYLVKAVNLRNREGYKLMSKEHSPVQFYKSFIIDRIDIMLKKKGNRLQISPKLIRSLDGRKYIKKVYKKQLKKKKSEKNQNFCQPCIFSNTFTKGS